jgi:hypothetical protein
VNFSTTFAIFSASVSCCGALGLTAAGSDGGTTNKARFDALDSRELPDDGGRDGMGIGNTDETIMAGRGPGASAASALAASIRAVDAAVIRAIAGIISLPMATVALTTRSWLK